MIHRQYTIMLFGRVIKGEDNMVNKIKAVMLGHAIGDALGVPVEFCNRKILEKMPVTDMMGYGTYHVPAGTWSDDTSMTLCALESLTKGKVDYDDIMNNFAKWYYNAEFTATGNVFGIVQTPENPPARAAATPVSIVSLCSPPGSLK